jgi:hypothetical protein
MPKMAEKITHRCTQISLMPSTTDYIFKKSKKIWKIVNMTFGLMHFIMQSEFLWLSDVAILITSNDTFAKGDL